MLWLVLAIFIVGGIWIARERGRRRTSKPLAGGLHEEITLPHTQEWELHHNSFSLCSRKLRVCMDELGHDYASHPIDLIETGSYENIGRDFLAVNPAGLVPVLVHDGHPIYESHDAIVYAARHGGARGRALLPDDDETARRVEHWIDCASIVGDDPTQGSDERAGNCIPGLTLPMFATMTQYIPLYRFVEGFLFHPDRRRPFVLALLKLRGVHRIPSLGPAAALLRRSRRDMGRHLDALAEQLDKHGGPWITGEAFTLADVSWMVILDRLDENDWANHFWGDGRRPTIAAYWQRLQARPSYQRQIADARCPITRRAIEDVRTAKRGSEMLRRGLEDEESGEA